MKRYILQLLLSCFLLSGISSFGKTVYDTYKGRVIREEAIRSEPVVEETRAVFSGLNGGNLAFRVVRTRRTVRWYRAIYEEVRVARDPDNPDDAGVSELVPGGELPGDPASRIEEEDLGPVPNAVFQMADGVSLNTGSDGVLIDDRQLLLQHFDGSRPEDLALTLTGADGSSVQLRLGRMEFWNAAGSAERGAVGLANPDPGQLQLAGAWDRPVYRPGDQARLTVTVKNTGSRGTVGFVKGGRAMSRHAWLDGPIFYLPPIPPGESRSFTRVFQVPKDIDQDVANLRVGFNEYSGSKPQLSLRLRIHR